MTGGHQRSDMTAAVSGDVAHRAFPGMGWRGCGRAGRATAAPFGLSRWGHPILRGTPPPRSAPPVTPTASPAPRSPTPRSPAWPATAHPATPAANRPSVMPRSAASPWPSTTPVVRSKTTERNSSPSWATLPEPIHGRIRRRPVPLSAHRPRQCQTSSSRSRSPRVERWSRTVRRALCARAQRARPARHAVGDRRYAPPTIKAARPFPTRRARPFERRVLPVPPGPLGAPRSAGNAHRPARPGPVEAAEFGSNRPRLSTDVAPRVDPPALTRATGSGVDRSQRLPRAGRVAYKRHIERFGSLSSVRVSGDPYGRSLMAVGKSLGTRKLEPQGQTGRGAIVDVLRQREI